MTNSRYDSEFCGSLPIHLINLIQPYGVLLVLDNDSYRIVQASENAEKVFNKNVEELVGTDLEKHILPNEFEHLKERNYHASVDKIPATWTIDGKEYLVLVHQKEKFILVELDLIEQQGAASSFNRVYQEIKYAMGLIQSANTLKDVAMVTARELKRISKFDKVMIYEFDKDWNGTVLAEEMEEGMESYNGITFPASDVPHPARQLYLKNPYRFIPSRFQEPVKLYPLINPLTSSFLDLSDCNLRAVPSVHLEYLANMNVEASMSTRILKGDSLWGLIACHHRTEMIVSFEMRSVFEMISNIVSAKVTSLQGSVAHSLSLRLKEGLNSIVEETYRQNDVNEALLNSSPDVLDLFNAQGVVISGRGALHTKGVVPDAESLGELILWLHTRQLKRVFYTDHLGQEYDSARAFEKEVSGMLVIPINSPNDEYVLIFRSEFPQVVNWGGNPNERIFFDNDEKTYHPRHSFKLWREQVEGKSMPWKEEEIVTAESLRSFIYEFRN